MSQFQGAKICAIIPARDEGLSIAGVIEAIPDWVSSIVVVDNGSSDETARIAREAGASVVSEPTPGYGRACLAGLAHADGHEIIVFLDGDGADVPQEMDRLIAPILQNEADLVIGSRLKGNVESGALTIPQRFGNRLACFLMRLIWRADYSDLGPFRSVRRQSLATLNMSAQTYGWTVEMQVRAVRYDLRTTEVPVSYRRRIGKSKISGTVRGVVLAGAHILGVIAREAASPKPQ